MSADFVLAIVRLEEPGAECAGCYLAAGDHGIETNGQTDMGDADFCKPCAGLVLESMAADYRAEGFSVEVSL